MHFHHEDLKISCVFAGVNSTADVQGNLAALSLKRSGKGGMAQEFQTGLDSLLSVPRLTKTRL